LAHPSFSSLPTFSELLYFSFPTDLIFYLTASPLCFNPFSTNLNFSRSPSFTFLNVASHNDPIQPPQIFQIPSNQIPINNSTQSEEEVVDHLPALKKECAKHCPAQKKEYDACVNRIAKLGEGDCEGWYFDLLHCVDHCVAPKAFKGLK